jgi:8-amino-7-oxononanoate synthase
MQSLDNQLAELQARSLHRQLREITSPPGTEMEFAGEKLANFSSNDYLGLAGEPFLREAAKRAIDAYGVGSGASRLVCGTFSPHVQLEEKLAEFKGTSAALTFSSGYAASVGTLGALLGSDDVVILDKLCHASLIDGARLCGAHVRVFPHHHLGKLESHLQWAREHHPDARVLVVTEAVFSMDGDLAPLAEIVEIKQRYDALLMVDEAHATGVIGSHGNGLICALGLGKQVEIHLGTMSKSLGVSGGFICGSRKLIDLLINRARSFIYSTAPPPALAAAASASLDFLSSAEGEKRRMKLWKNLRQLEHELPPAQLAKRKVESAIFPIILGEEEAALSAARTLRRRGFFIPAIRYPTVAKGAARLRVTVSANHTAPQITALCGALTRL